MDLKEIIKWLKEMRVNIDIPKAAITQCKKNEAIDSAVLFIENYEARLKAEKVAALEEIKAEIKEKEKEYLHALFIDLDAQDKTEHEKIIDIIDQKIERLKW